MCLLYFNLYIETNSFSETLINELGRFLWFTVIVQYTEIYSSSDWKLGSNNLSESLRQAICQFVRLTLRFYYTTGIFWALLITLFNWHYNRDPYTISHTSTDILRPKTMFSYTRLPSINCLCVCHIDLNLNPIHIFHCVKKRMNWSQWI